MSPMPTCIRQLWLAAVPSISSSGALKSGSHSFTSLWIVGTERAKKYSPKSNSSQLSFDVSRQMRAGAVIVPCRGEKERPPLRNLIERMKRPQEKAKGRSLHMKCWNWADTLNHSQDSLFTGGNGFRYFLKNVKCENESAQGKWRWAATQPIVTHYLLQSLKSTSKCKHRKPVLPTDT